MNNDSSTSVPKNVTIGRRTYHGRNCSFVARDGGTIEIGSFCSIAGDVEIYNVNHNYKGCISTYPMSILMLESKDPELIRRDREIADVKIGNDVWIGTKAVILKGVVIGDGAVIGASAVVTKSVPPYAIVGGNPAKVLKYRYEPAEIAALLKIKWWDWSDDVIRANVDAFYGPIGDFIEKFGMPH